MSQGLYNTAYNHKEQRGSEYTSGDSFEVTLICLLRNGSNLYFLIYQGEEEGGRKGRKVKQSGSRPRFSADYASMKRKQNDTF